jgi:hypothetical protein
MCVANAAARNAWTASVCVDFALFAMHLGEIHDAIKRARKSDPGSRSRLFAA